MSDPTPEKRSRPNVHFFHAEHIEERADEIWDQCKNADVILFELITDSKTRQDLEGIINYASFSDMQEDKDRAIRAISPAFNDGLFQELVPKIINAGKEIYLIDVNIGEDSQIEAGEAYAFNSKAVDLFHHGDIENSFLNYKQFINHLAHSSEEREEITANEIQGILDENQQKWSGKNIVVIQGALHTRTYHKIKAKNNDINLSRSFRSSKYEFMPNFALTRKLIFGKPVTEDDYRRGYLAYLVLTDALIDIKGYEIADEEAIMKAGEIATKMTDADLKEYWNELKVGSLDREELIKRHS